MRLAIFGVTGFSGRAVLEGALARGYQVVALARDPQAVHVAHERLTVLRGDALAREDVAACVGGADAVVHCLGVGGKGTGQPTTLVSDSVALVLAAMEEAGVRRLVCMSNVGAGGSGPWLVNRVVIPIAFRWLVPLIDDKDRMEALLEASDAEWISVRLPKIVEGPAKPVRTSADGRGLSLSITTSSVAAFMLDRVSGDAFLHSTPSVSN
jgi:uncharacterized protein YbjT (DUF2867 family)